MVFQLPWLRQYPFAEIYANGSRTMLYRPELNDIIGDDVLANILLQQVMFRACGRRDEAPDEPFYKFFGPCSHELYIEGDSWSEELNVSSKRIRTSLKKVATKVARGSSKKEILAKVDPISLILFWTDTNRVTWWQFNWPVFNELCRRRTDLNLQTGNYLGKVPVGNYLDKVPTGNYLETDDPAFTSPYTKKIYKDDLQRDKKEVTKEQEATNNDGNGHQQKANNEHSSLAIPEKLLRKKVNSKAGKNLSQKADGLNTEPRLYEWPSVKSTSSQQARVTGRHQIVRDLIAERVDDVDGFLEWRGSILAKTPFYMEGGQRVTAKTVLHHYSKKLITFGTGEEKAFALATLIEAIEADIESWPKPVQEACEEQQNDLFEEIFALYEKDPGAAYRKAQSLNYWNEFLRRKDGN